MALGALKLLREFLEEALTKGRTGLDEATEIGAKFRQADPEEYFATTPLPARNAREAENIYGVQINKIPEERSVAISLPGNDGEHVAEIFRAGESGQGRRFPKSALELFKELPPDQQVYTIDSMSSRPTTGLGRRSYPAFYDVLSGQHGMINMSEGLMPDNMVRRNFNTGDAYLRNPELHGKIIPDSTQLQIIGTNPRWFHEQATPDQQVGSMMLGGALNALQYGGAPAGSNAARKMSVIEEILSGRDPETWKHLGLKKGGIVGSRSPLAKYCSEACKCSS